VPLGEEVEEQLASGPVERHEAELVDDQEVDALVATEPDPKRWRLRVGS